MTNNDLAMQAMFKEAAETIRLGQELIRVIDRNFKNKPEEAAAALSYALAVYSTRAAIPHVAVAMGVRAYMEVMEKIPP